MGDPFPRCAHDWCALRHRLGLSGFRSHGDTPDRVFWKFSDRTGAPTVYQRSGIADPNDLCIADASGRSVAHLLTGGNEGLSRRRGRESPTLKKVKSML